jgi:hypothetical protein
VPRSLIALVLIPVAFVAGCMPRAAYTELPPASKCAISRLSIDYAMPDGWLLECREPVADWERVADGYCRCVEGRDERPWRLVVLLRAGDDSRYRQAVAQVIAHEMGHAWAADNDPDLVFDEDAADRWACEHLPHATPDDKREWCDNLPGAWV